MLKNFDDMQKYGKENMDATVKVWGQVSKGVQAIATETADYSKKSFEEGSAALEKLLGAKSLDKAIEIQTSYAKTAYESFVAQATKLSELYTDLAKETYKPFENLIGKTAVVAK
jgi:phasin family protein